MKPKTNKEIKDEKAVTSYACPVADGHDFC